MQKLSENIIKQGTAVALGFFDGIHLGHKAVLQRALDEAEKRKLVPVITIFDMHPKKLLTGKAPPIIMSDAKKRRVLSDMGFITVDFSFGETVDYTPDEFIEKILIEALGAKVVSCGFDYRYGKGGEGNAQTLHDELEKRGIETFSHEAVLLDGEKISSTAIRRLVSQGNIEKANQMLGTAFSYDFTVKKGDGLGRTMGFPTINQFFSEDFVVPKYGVYASRVNVDGKWYNAVTNVGVRPTLDKTSMRSETCILDFTGDLYGKSVEVALVKYLRNEMKFPDLDALSIQIECDIERARDILERYK